MMMAPINDDDRHDERVPMLPRGAPGSVRGRVSERRFGVGDRNKDEEDEFDDDDGANPFFTSYVDHLGERRSAMTTTTTMPPHHEKATKPSNNQLPPPTSPPSPTHLEQHLHEQSVEAYLRQFQWRAVECVSNAYERSNCVPRTHANGSLGTSLPEDVIFLFETQLSVLQEYLRKQHAKQTPPPTSPLSLWDTARGQQMYHDAIVAILECLTHTQKCVRPVFVTTLEGCCEAANDFVRLSDRMEQMLAEWMAKTTTATTQQQQPHESESTEGRPEAGHDKVVAAWNEYVALLSQDAVGAAERTHVFVVRDFVAFHAHHPNHRHRNAPGSPPPAALFSYQWEVECTNNEIITCLLEDVCERHHWSKIRRYLDHDILRNKAVVALCRAVVCYYVRCLVERADAALRKRQARPHNHPLIRLGRGGGGGRGRQRPGAHHHHGGFLHSGRALRRMKDDIAIIKQYFVSKAKGNPTLARIVSNEVYILELIHECLDAASGGDDDDVGDDNNDNSDTSDDDLFLDSFIVVIHKRTGCDALVTRHFVGDLFLLVNHQERPLQLTVLQQDLHLVTKRMEEVKAAGGGGGGGGCAANTKKKDAEILSLVSVDQMLRAMYEDRIVQGMLPLCWTCLPKVEAEDGSGMELVSAKIREITRGVADLKMKRRRTTTAPALGKRK